MNMNFLSTRLTQRTLVEAGHNSIFDTSCMLVVVNRTEPKNTRHIKDKGRWNERGFYFYFSEKGPEY